MRRTTSLITLIMISMLHGFSALGQSFPPPTSPPSPMNEISVTGTVPASELAFVTIHGKAAYDIFQHLAKDKKPEYVDCSSYQQHILHGESISCIQVVYPNKKVYYTCSANLTSEHGKLTGGNLGDGCLETVAGVGN